LFTVLTKRPRDLAAQYDAHIHCGGRAASLPALVHCVVFPHGHYGPAICGALWRRPCCGVDERLNVEIRQRGRILWAVKLYIGGQVDETRRDVDARLRQGICVLGRTTEHVPPRISSHSCGVFRYIFVPSLVTMLRHAPPFSLSPSSTFSRQAGHESRNRGQNPITCPNLAKKDVPHPPRRQTPPRTPSAPLSETLPTSSHLAPSGPDRFFPTNLLCTHFSPAVSTEMGGGVVFLIVVSSSTTAVSAAR
jgi:hypothetical protein